MQDLKHDNKLPRLLSSDHSDIAVWGGHLVKIVYQVNLSSVSREFTIYSREWRGKEHGKLTSSALWEIRSLAACAARKDGGPSISRQSILLDIVSVQSALSDTLWR